MAYIMTLIGLIIAVVIFIYTINLIDSGKRTLTQITDPVTVSAAPHPDGHTVNSGIKRVTTKNCAISELTDREKDMIPTRRCPVCQTVLKRDEPLYAGNTYPDGKRTILIYGCQHCYREKNTGEEPV